jgi:hypothetical protein
VESGGLSVPLTIRELRVPKDIDKLLERALHDDLVVETLEDILQDIVKVNESLRWLGSRHLRSTQIGKLASEVLGRLDLGWIIQSEDTENVTSFKNSSWLLDEVDHTGLLSDQRHVHLHDLNLSERLTLANVVSVLN